MQLYFIDWMCMCPSPNKALEELGVPRDATPGSAPQAMLAQPRPIPLTKTFAVVSQDTIISRIPSR